LRRDIGSGGLATWDAVHDRYKVLWEHYPREKQKHGFAVLCFLHGSRAINEKQWVAALDKGVAIQEFVRDQVYISRKKDDENPFRKATYRNDAEMKATVGTVEDNEFIKQVRKETAAFEKSVAAIKLRSDNY